MRGFSLIEAMIAVSMLGIFAALATPSLIPEVHKAQLNGNTESAANFIARARAEAMISKRCVRVRVDTVPNPDQLVMERINSFDCETATPVAPFAGAPATAFIQLARLAPDSPSVSFTLALDPPFPAGASLRIRPNGRVASDNGVGATPTLTDDDAVVDVTHARLPVGQRTRRILYNSNGLMCVTARGQALLGVSPDFSCP